MPLKGGKCNTPVPDSKTASKLNNNAKEQHSFSFFSLWRFLSWVPCVNKCFFFSVGVIVLLAPHGLTETREFQLRHSKQLLLLQHIGRISKTVISCSKILPVTGSKSFFQLNNSEFLGNILLFAIISTINLLIDLLVHSICATNTRFRIVLEVLLHNHHRPACFSFFDTGVVLTRRPQTLNNSSTWNLNRVYKRYNQYTSNSITQLGSFIYNYTVPYLKETLRKIE